MTEFFTSGEFYSTFCAVLWGLAIVLFRRSGEHVSPVALNLYKNVLAVALFLPLLPLLGVAYIPEHATASDWIVLGLSGALGIGLADTLFFRALNRLGAGRIAIVDCLYSPFIILCSFFYLDNTHLGPGLFVAMGLMVAAILVGTWSPNNGARNLSGTGRTTAPRRAGMGFKKGSIFPRRRGQGHVAQGKTNSDAENRPGRPEMAAGHERQVPERRPSREIRNGILLGVAAQFIMAANIVIAKPVLDVHDGWWVTTVRLVAGVAYLAVQSCFRAHRADVVRAFRPGPHWRILVPASFIGAFLAMLFWILGMKYTDTTIAGILNQSSVLFVLLFATLFLKEPLTLRRSVAIGMGFIAGVIVML